MRRHHRHHRRPTAPVILGILAGIAAVYVAVLFGINAIGNRLERGDAAEPVGSLEDRFVTDELTLEAQGRTWTYRSGLTNLLFIGVDWDAARLETADSRYEGQADFLLLVSLDRENRTATSIQIDRDTLADIRVYGAFGDYAGTRRTQICLSYAFGDTAEAGCENTAWAVSRLMGGIPIDACLAMDMEGITALNEALGGVTVTLEDDFSSIDPQMTQGATITLQGDQAELFVRGRMGVSDGTNQSRMRRQNAFLTAALDELTEGMAEDMNYVSELLDALSPYLATDVDRGWLINRAYESREYARSDIRQIAGSHAVGEDGFVEFTADAEALNDLLVEVFFE